MQRSDHGSQKLNRKRTKQLGSNPGGGENWFFEKGNCIFAFLFAFCIFRFAFCLFGFAFCIFQNHHPMGLTPAKKNDRCFEKKVFLSFALGVTTFLDYPRRPKSVLKTPAVIFANFEICSFLLKKKTFGVVKTTFNRIGHLFSRYSRFCFAGQLPLDEPNNAPPLFNSVGRRRMGPMARAGTHRPGPARICIWYVFLLSLSFRINRLI